MAIPKKNTKQVGKKHGLRLFSCDPFLLLQGVVVFTAFLGLAIFAGNFFISYHKAVNILAVQNTVTRQSQTAVAGLPVHYTVLVKASAISKNQHLVKLPKGATNIIVKKIGAKQAGQLLSQKKPKPQVLGLAQKKSLALVALKKPLSKSFLARLAALFLADLTGAPTEDTVVNQDPVTVDVSVVTPDVPVILDAPVILDTPVTPDAPVISDAPAADAPPQDPAPPAPDPAPIPDDQYVQVTYDAPAPQITEQITDTGKTVTVSDPVEDPQNPVTDVLAFTKIPEIYKIGQEEKIQIKWQNNGGQDVAFRALDTDGNGRLDYVEWTVSHLSSQTFQIIFISKAFQLDQDQNIVADIFDQVKDQDGNFATVPQHNFVRFTFEKRVTNANDITLYARPSGSTPVTINVFPVYTDDDGNVTEGPQLVTVNDGKNPDFSNIDHEGVYRILLQHLQTPTDQFDLQITGADADIDYIVDPSGNLVAYWKFDEATTTSGATIVDSSGNSYTGTPAGAGGSNNLPQPNSSVSSSITGFTDAKSLSFDGTDDKVTFSTITTGTSWTFSAWLKPTTTAMAFGCLFATSNGTGLYDSGGNINFYNSGSNLSSSGLTNDVWTSVIVTNSAGNITFYLNGTSSGTSVNGGIMASTNIGGGAGFFSGSIDDMRIYSRVLNSTEIAALAAGTHTTATWTGTTNTTYATTTNWDISAAPDPYTKVVIADVTNDPVLGGDQSLSALTINSGGVLDLAGYNLTVKDSGAFNNSGTLKLTGANTLTGFTNDTDSGTVTYTGTSSYTGLSAGNTYNNLTFNGSGGTWTLNAALTVNGDFTITAGTLDASASNYGITVGGTWSNSGTFTPRSGTLTLTGTSTFSDTTSLYNLTINGSAKTVTLGGALTVSNNLTITAGTLDVSAAGCSSASCAVSVGANFSDSGTFTGQTGTLTLASGTHTLTGATTFYNLTLAATNTITFPASTTQTIGGTLSCTGTSGHVITINSSSGGTAATLSKSSGTVTCDYLSLTDSAATGGATFNPGTNSTSVSGNSGWVFNSAPSISAGPSDGGSYASAPTNVGSNVTFTATATDSNSDNYYLAICKTNSVTAVNSAAPTCGGGSWAISSSTASGAQASVTYAAQSGDSATSAWYAFVCDSNSGSLCSSSSQGSGNNGSPFATNHAPTFSAIANTSGYIPVSSTVTFTTTASDSDSDNVTLYVCKANDFSAGACGAGGEWCHSSAGASNPSCAYTVVSGDSDGSHTYYGNIIDANSFVSASNPRSSTFTTDKTAPTTSDNYASDGSWVAANQSITLTPADATSGVASTKYCTDSANTCDPTTGTSYTTAVTMSTEGTRYFRYESTDSAGNVQTTVSRTVKIDKTAAAVDAGADQTKRASFTQTSTDSDATSGIASYLWAKQSGTGTITFGSSTSAATTVSSNTEGTFVIRLTVTDNAGNTNYDEFTLIWDTTNPSVNAGTDQSQGASYTQNATVSDAGSGVASYLWAKQSGTGTIAFGTSTAEDTTISSNTDGTFVIRLTVTDNAGNSTYDEMTLIWDTVAPTTTDDYSSKDGNWQAGSQTITLTPADASSGIAITQYCTDAFNVCNPVLSGTTYTAAVIISTEGTSYFRYASSDNAGNNQTAVSRTVKIDGTGPTTDAGADQVANSQITQTATASDSASGLASYQWSKTSGPGSVTFGTSTALTTTIEPGPSGNYVIRFTATDAAGNSGYDEFTLSWNMLTGGGGSGSSGAATSSNTEAPSPVSQPSVFQQIIQPIQNLINSVIKSATPSPASNAPSIPTQAPEALKNWDLMTAKPLGLSNVAMVPSDASFFAGKFPDLQLNQSEKLKNVRFDLPGFSQTAKAEIPTDVVFAKTGKELIDYHTSLVFDSQGNATQKITTVAGKPLELIVKPDKPVKTVTGYMVLTQKTTALNSTPASGILNSIAKYFTAALNSASAPATKSSTELLLQKFEYVKSSDGFYVAHFNAPSVEGTYEVITVMDYQDPNLLPKEIRLVTVVDPEGYIYEQLSRGRLRILGATVSLYWKNQKTSQFESWPAETYLQKNPVVTDDTGKYSFLTPEGTYYLQVKAPNYQDYKSDTFTIAKGSIGVYLDIALKPVKTSWWQRLLSLLFGK